MHNIQFSKYIILYVGIIAIGNELFDVIPLTKCFVVCLVEHVYCNLWTHLLSM